MKTQFAPKSALALLLYPIAALTGFLVFTSGVRAQESDPPTRVARISYLHGSVSFQPGGAGDWASAQINRPMTVGDRIWSDSGARAELQAGAAAIRLDGSTALSFLNLDDRTIQMRIAEGAINFRVRELRSGELYEVDAPNLAFTVTHAGAFRVDVSEGGDFTGVTVFRGEGEVTAGGRTYKVREGERGAFTGVENPQYSIEPAPRPDNFDRWAMERDLRDERSHSARYVSRDVIGYEDLDDYGSWRYVPDYGPVWYPTYVDAGWAPYRYGYWSWVGPWGWTWIDYAPWGFAPYHYGRWAYIGGYWGWIPGPLYVRPVYAPALVAFIGGSRWGLSFGFGNGWGAPVGWFPLGFGEPFFPWFRCSRTFITNINISNTVIRNVNIIHTTNVRNVNFVNAHNLNAVTAVPQRAFANAEAVNRAAMRVSPEMLSRAEVTTRVGVTPTDRSVLGATAGSRVVTPPAAIQNRPVFTRTEPAAAARNLPVRPMNPGAQLAERGQASTSRPAMTGRPNVPDVHPMSPRERELAQDKPQQFGETVRGAAILPQARGQADARPGAPQNVERLGDRSAGRPADTLSNRPDMAAPQRPSEPASRPTVRNERMTQADRPPWARGSGSGALDVRPPSNVDRGAREMSRPREASSPRPPQMNDRPNDRPAPQSRYESWPSDRTAERPAERTPGRTLDRSGRFSGPPRQESRPAPSYDRGYRAPESPRYSAPAPGSYSAPRSYSAPSPRSYSAPPRSYSSPRSYSAPRGGSRGYSAPASRGSGRTSRDRG